MDPRDRDWQTTASRPETTILYILRLFMIFGMYRATAVRATRRGPRALTQADHGLGRTLARQLNG